MRVRLSPSAKNVIKKKKEAILGCFFGFIISFANLFHQWDVLLNIDKCYEKATNFDESKICATYFYDSTGQSLYPYNYNSDPYLNIVVAFKPFMWVLFYIIIMLFALFVYNIGNNWNTIINQKEERRK